MKFILKYKLSLAGLALGAMAGYFYYQFWGCTSGCAITSSPVNSTIYGAFLGVLVFNIFKKEEIKEEEKPH